MSHLWVVRLFLVILLSGSATLASAAPPQGHPPKGRAASWESIGQWLQQKEFVQMLTAIATGNIKAGWFHPGQSACSWRWVLARFDANRDGVVQAKEWPGPRELFDRLDRDHDRRLTAADFNWSDDTPLARQLQIADQLLRRADTSHDGKVSAEEWQSLFARAARGQKTLSREQLHELLFPPPAPRRSSGGMPSPLTLLRCLLAGELGSALEGPAVGQEAPDFLLQTHDGKWISLRDYRDRKPVVLVFGSFT